MDTPHSRASRSKTVRVNDFAIRPATVADLPACHSVWLSTEGDVPASADPTSVVPPHEHELRTGELIVAESNGTVVGFGATLTRSGVAYLADLFVRPEHQASGVGRALLHELLDDLEGPRFTLASTDPRAQRLYTTFEMLAIEDFSYLCARQSEVAFDDLDSAGIELLEVGVSDDVLRIDREVTRRDRRSDLVHAERHLGARTFVGRRGGQTIGYASFAHPIWWNPWHSDAVRIGPIAVLDPADSAALLSITVLATRDLNTDWLCPFAPTSNPGHDQLVAAGFRIADTDRLMASDPALLDLQRYLPAVDTA